MPSVIYAPVCGFVLNDIFTPYTTNTAWKPRGYNFYANLYNYYQVLETRWTVHISSVASSQAAVDGTKSTPYAVAVQISDNSHTVLGDDRTVYELGHNNGCDKTLVVHGPRRISPDFARAPNDVGGSLTFSGIWTPAKFDDLQINIQYNPMTQVTSQPNWKNFLDLVWINYNKNAPADPDIFLIELHVEQLVHFKKINTTRYATAN